MICPDCEECGNCNCAEWISIEDRVPLLDQPVLVYVKVNKDAFSNGDFWDVTISEIISFYGIGFQKEGEDWACTLSNSMKVTHWMPLPEPPKE